MRLVQKTQGFVTITSIRSLKPIIIVLRVVAHPSAMIDSSPITAKVRPSPKARVFGRGCDEIVLACVRNVLQHAGQRVPLRSRRETRRNIDRLAAQMPPSPKFADRTIAFADERERVDAVVTSGTSDGCCRWSSSVFHGASDHRVWTRLGNSRPVAGGAEPFSPKHSFEINQLPRLHRTRPQPRGVVRSKKRNGSNPPRSVRHASSPRTPNLLVESPRAIGSGAYGAQNDSRNVDRP